MVTKAQRDYSVEFDTVVDRLRSKTGEVVVGVLADKVVAFLEESDPELLNGWLWENARPLVAKYLQMRVVTDRAVASHQAKARAFGTAVEEHFRGNSRPLSLFAQAAPFGVDNEFTRPPIGKLTGSNCSTISDKYAGSAKTHSLMAEFWKAVARKAGKNTIEQVMTEEEFIRLRGSIVA